MTTEKRTVHTSNDTLHPFSFRKRTKRKVKELESQPKNRKKKEKKNNKKRKEKRRYKKLTLLINVERVTVRNKRFDEHRALERGELHPFPSLHHLVHVCFRHSTLDQAGGET